MENDTQLKELLAESDIEIKLRDYFVKMSELVGEEYTCLTFAERRSVKSSLSIFSYGFESYTDDDITIALLKRALLSKKNQSTINIVKELVSKNEIYSLLLLSELNRKFRKDLVINFIEQYSRPNLELYKSVNNKQSALSNLVTLKRYELMNEASLGKRGIK